MGPDLANSTWYPSREDAAAARRPWLLVDARGQVLGKLASLVAAHIRGKRTAAYTPSMDLGAYVVVINSAEVAVTGRKEEQKTYFSNRSRRPGHGKLESLAHLRQRLPTRIVERAVWGMLPKGRLGRRLFTHLKVFPSDRHPHEAQAPVDITHLIVAPSSLVRAEPVSRQGAGGAGA